MDFSLTHHIQKNSGPPSYPPKKYRGHIYHGKASKYKIYIQIHILMRLKMHADSPPYTSMSS
jgi:hypothetical protein